MVVAWDGYPVACCGEGSFAFKQKEKLLGQVGFIIPKILSSFDEICDHLQSIAEIIDPAKSWLLTTGWAKCRS